MKYMHFNSSCSYAGLANLLESRGIEVEDYEIALGMKLPLLLRFDEHFNAFISGPMLQTAEYFNLYLHPLGLNFSESRINKNQLLTAIETPCMFPMLRPNGSKHAVVCRGKKEGHWEILNMKHRESDEAEQFFWDDQELLQHCEELVLLGQIEDGERKAINWTPVLEESLRVLDLYQEELLRFLSAPVTREELRTALDPLFRALLLDGISMMQLLKQDALVAQLKEMQAKLLTAIRSESASLSTNLFTQAEGEAVLQRWRTLIQAAFTESQVHAG